MTLSPSKWDTARKKALLIFCIPLVFFMYLMLVVVFYFAQSQNPCDWCYYVDWCGSLFRDTQLALTRSLSVPYTSALPCGSDAQLF